MRARSLPQKAVWFGLVLLLWVFPAVVFSSLLRFQTPASSSSTSAIQDSPAQRKARMSMVETQIAGRGVRDRRVLDALRAVPRHLFVPLEMQPYAYLDTPLPIGHGQTISQPYIVGFMSEALKLRPQDRVLEIGTGSGYQAAVLALLVREVYTIEIVEPLGTSASERLQRLGYTNVKVRVGDGYKGWPEAAPFDAIIVTAAPGHIPRPLLDQLAPGGRLVIPVGESVQTLVRVHRTAKGFQKERLLPVRFVPMTGKAEN
jgi:protein-L-isoaspartate(D-aspartate) O-methyltransferase